MENQMRLFVAVNIPESMKDKLYQIGDILPQEALKRVEKSNLHITLGFLGEIPSFRLGEIISALETVKFRKFNLALRGAGVFPNKNYVKVAWIGCESEELSNLAKNVSDALNSFCEFPPFTAHLTISRVRKKIDASKFLEKYGEADFGEFGVSSFELMQSVLGKNGPCYSVVSSFEATPDSSKSDENLKEE